MVSKFAMEERSLEAAVNNDDDQPSTPTSTGGAGASSTRARNTGGSSAGATSTGARSKNSVSTETPGRFDVLLGRGKKNTGHHGNEQLQTVLNMHSVRYNSTTSRNEKTAITKEIVQSIQTTGEPPGRFLKFDKDANGWVEVDDVAARIKVSHAIRYASRYKKRKAPPAHSEPSSQEAKTMSSDTLLHREAHQQEPPSDRSPLVFDESILAGLGQDPHSSNDTHDDDASVLIDRSHQQINEDPVP
jgi:hypothetical protein